MPFGIWLHWISWVTTISECAAEVERVLLLLVVPKSYRITELSTWDFPTLASEADTSWWLDPCSIRMHSFLEIIFFEALVNHQQLIQLCLICEVHHRFFDICLVGVIVSLILCPVPHITSLSVRAVDLCTFFGARYLHGYCIAVLRFMLKLGLSLQH